MQNRTKQSASNNVNKYLKKEERAFLLFALQQLLEDILEDAAKCPTREQGERDKFEQHILSVCSRAIHLLEHTLIPLVRQEVDHARGLLRLEQKPTGFNQKLLF